MLNYLAENIKTQNGETTENIADGDCDAANAMMQLGDLMRKLRQMEREDEAQRERENDSNEITDTLDYKSFLSNQNYYDDYKHVNYRFIDFGTIGDQPCVIQQDRTVGKGGFVWDSGFILAEHMITAKEFEVEKPTSVVELGAGTGVTGVLVAKSFPTAKVHLTDLPALQPLLKVNTDDTPNASFGVLGWGETVLDQKYDVVLGADVVASIYDCSGLVKTIYDLTNKDSKVYLACRDRLAGSIEKLEEQLKHLFTQVERRKAVSSNKNPDIWILFASGRRSSQ